MTNEVILAVLGNWENEKSLKRELFLNGYKFSVNNIKCPDNDLIIYGFLNGKEHDIEEQLNYFGRENFTSDDIEFCLTHDKVFYIHVKINKYEDLLHVLKLGEVFFDIGGICIKIHSSGIAYTRRRWFELKDAITFSYDREEEIILLYSTFISIIIDNTYIFTTGMSAFNLPDIIFELGFGTNDKDIDKLLSVINNLNMNQIIDDITLESGIIFNLPDSEEDYILDLVEDHRFHPRDARRNHVGLWKISIATDEDDYFVNDI